MKKSYHDIWQRCISRLVKSQVGTDHCRQFDSYRFETAVNFARHFKMCITVSFNFACKHCLRPVEQTGHELTRLTRIIIDCLETDSWYNFDKSTHLFANKYKIEFIVFCNFCQHSCYMHWFHRFGCRIVNFNMYSLIGPLGKSST